MRKGQSRPKISGGCSLGPSRHVVRQTLIMSRLRVGQDDDFLDPDATPSPSGSDQESDGDFAVPAGDDDGPFTAARAQRERRIPRKLEERVGSTPAKDKGKAREDDLRRKVGQSKIKSSSKGFSWEATYERSWDTVYEDESGTLEGAVSDILMGSSRIKR